MFWLARLWVQENHLPKLRIFEFQPFAGCGRCTVIYVTGNRKSKLSSVVPATKGRFWKEPPNNWHTGFESKSSWAKWQNWQKQSILPWYTFQNLHSREACKKKISQEERIAFQAPYFKWQCWGVQVYQTSKQPAGHLCYILLHHGPKNHIPQIEGSGARAAVHILAHICMPGLAAYNMYMVYFANHQTRFNCLMRSFGKVTMFFDLSRDLNGFDASWLSLLNGSFQKTTTPIPQSLYD